MAPALIEGAMSPALNQSAPGALGPFQPRLPVHAHHLNNFRVGLHARAADVVAHHVGPGPLQKIGLTGRQSSGRHHAARAVQRHVSELER